MFSCSQSLFSSVVYIWTFVVCETGREGKSFFPQLRFHHNETVRVAGDHRHSPGWRTVPRWRRRRWTPQQTWKQENCFTSSGGGQSYLGGFLLPTILSSKFSASHNRHIASSDFVFSKIFDSFYFLNNCECFSSFLSDISWQPKCFALDWSCLCQIQHFTHLHQSQRVDVALLYFAIFVA